MIIHLIYATYSSATLAAAEHIKTLLEEQRHSCEIMQVGQTKLNERESADLLRFGSPSWERENFKYNGQPHEDFFTLFTTYGYHVDVQRDERHSSLDLSGTPCAVFGLGDKKYPVFCGAVDILTDFLEFSKATCVVKPLRIDNYYFHEPERKKEIDLWVGELLAALG